MHHNRYDRAGNKRKRSNRRDRPGKAKKISDAVPSPKSRLPNVRLARLLLPGSIRDPAYPTRGRGEESVPPGIHSAGGSSGLKPRKAQPAA
jgi:hypothetical protein